MMRCSPTGETSSNSSIPLSRSAPEASRRAGRHAAGTSQASVRVHFISALDKVPWVGQGRNVDRDQHANQPQVTRRPLQVRCSSQPMGLRSSFRRIQRRKKPSQKTGVQSLRRHTSRRAEAVSSCQERRVL